jgi:hypothetical protein
VASSWFIDSSVITMMRDPIKIKLTIAFDNLKQTYGLKKHIPILVKIQ